MILMDSNLQIPTKITNAIPLLGIYKRYAFTCAECQGFTVSHHRTACNNRGLVSTI